MNTSKPSLLLCTNGAPQGLPALSYGAWLAQALQLPVTLLGIIEQGKPAVVVEQALHSAQAQLEAHNVAYTVTLRQGNVRTVICAEAAPEQHIVVIGPLGRPRLRRWLKGRSLRRLIPALRAPLLYAPAARYRLARILLCTGALMRAGSAEEWALQLARRAGAALTILHVAEPASYHYPTAEKVAAGWHDLLQTNTPQARQLGALLAQAQKLGAAATLQVRHGAVVHEIIAEARRDRYDLVVMGSKHSAHSLRRLYLPDVTAVIMETLDTPVLAVRSGQPYLLTD